ncbi:MULTISPECIES: hypothetical protein [unclassified Paenibacillus]|uniref:hypothetical protein n=1 Tax=unclassified Paenibacillus TaxID=185978 RepID=UPI0003E2BE2E|nr:MULTISPECIES: hypothetical protein [unclassified Paenibacillus]ETT43594.1 hypothetical protein C162_24705 [Paenibacillus sp. FSL R7-269]OMF94880.1 hypothetical protein BK147_15990 [Paenibacillus sp. FSL R7-0337]
MAKRIVTTDAELQSVMLIGAPVDIWMGNHLCEKKQKLSSYSSSAIQSNESYYLRPNVQMAHKLIKEKAIKT